MSEEKEYTGGSVSYYSIDVNAPLNEKSDPYTAECQDLIEALKLDFNEGSAFKAIWRRATARLGRSKKGYDDGLYDAEKIVFYGRRLVAIEQRAKRYFESPLALSDTADIELKLAAELVSPAEQPVADAIEVFTADPFGPRDAEGWYAWNGDETLRPAGYVDYRMRCDNLHENGSAEGLRWNHNGSSGDIVKWRPALPYEIGPCANKRCSNRGREISPYCEKCEPDL